MKTLRTEQCLLLQPCQRLDFLPFGKSFGPYTSIPTANLSIPRSTIPIAAHTMKVVRQGKTQESPPTRHTTFPQQLTNGRHGTLVGANHVARRQEQGKNHVRARAGARMLDTMQQTATGRHGRCRQDLVLGHGGANRKKARERWYFWCCLTRAVAMGGSRQPSFGSRRNQRSLLPKSRLEVFRSKSQIISQRDPL